MDKIIKGTLTDVAALNTENIKENIIFQLINTEHNKELLSTIPHREFNDLSIIYRWEVSADERGVQSAIINNDLAESFALTEKILFNLAKENTKRIHPVSLMVLNDINPATTMYALTNEKMFFGATSMLYDEELNKLSERMNSDLYIMPSSIHEILVVSASTNKPEELSNMVEEVNMSEVLLEERLSNQVYHYNRQTREITVATNNPRQISGEVTYDTMQRKGR